MVACFLHLAMRFAIGGIATTPLAAAIALVVVIPDPVFFVLGSPRARLVIGTCGPRYSSAGQYAKLPVPRTYRAATSAERATVLSRPLFAPIWSAQIKVSAIRWWLRETSSVSCPLPPGRRSCIRRKRGWTGGEQKTGASGCGRCTKSGGADPESLEPTKRDAGGLKIVSAHSGLRQHLGVARCIAIRPSRNLIPFRSIERESSADRAPSARARDIRSPPSS